MKLALVNLTGGGLCGGSQKYLRHMIPLLQSHSKIKELSVYIPEQSLNKVHLDGVNIQTWPKDDALRGFPTLKSKISAESPDVVFIPNGWWVDFGWIPTVSMIRNMQPMVAPFAGYGLRGKAVSLLRLRTCKSACKRSNRVIAVSGFVKDYLVQKWRIEGQKVGVVYHGIDPGPDCAQTTAPSSLAGHNLSNFLFTAGSLLPYRGLEDVIGALGRLKKQGYTPSLVIAGEPEAGLVSYKANMIQMAEQHEVSSQIVWAGHLTTAEMSWSFYNSDAFIMTSRVEACPNIALEAMSHGSFCVSTDQAPMPEFFTDSALYYKKGDSESMAEQLKVILNTSEAAKQLKRKRALERSQDFSWRMTAENTIAQLEMAL